MPTKILSRLASGAANALFPGRCLHCRLAPDDLPARHVGTTARELCDGCQDDLVPLVSHCNLCAEPLADAGICGNCLSRTPDFSRIRAPFLYTAPLSDWINGFKHHGDLRTGRLLGQLLSEHIARQPALEAPDFLLPMPLHWQRRFSRGFNQAQELARVVGDDLGLQLAPGLVRRSRHTPHQQNLSRRARRQNLHKAFTVRGDCRGLRIAVIDDVVTTASTARAIATTLLSAGARSVEIWAVARAGKTVP